MLGFLPILEISQLITISTLFQHQSVLIYKASDGLIQKVKPYLLHLGVREIKVQNKLDFRC